MFNTRDAGNPAGSKRRSGEGYPHYTVKINQMVFCAHRIVYALIHEKDPWPQEIDHIDRNPLNNTPDNLRAAIRSENASNKNTPRNNTSGTRGVTWCKRTGQWMAQIGHHGRTIFIGRFDAIASAIQAREAIEAELHGEFSPLHTQATQ